MSGSPWPLAVLPVRSGRARAPALVLVLVLSVALVVVLSGCGLTSDLGPPAADGTDGSGDVPSGTLVPGDARTALSGLRVSPGGDMTGYERSCSDGEGCVFGPAWADVDRNGCDTRNDVLRRDLREVRTRDGTDGCVVVSGQLVDPYTGEVVDFRKERAGDVSIDHVVSLADAWRSGAANWDDQRRRQFANDPGNLLATERGVNSAKSDATPARWLPALPEARCPYARIVVTIKSRYRLTVRADEWAVLDQLLAIC